jgi:hypothetical protein
MVYIIAILLLILVLANDRARGMLGLLIVGAIILAIAGGVLFGLVILGLWLFESKSSTKIAPPSPHTPVPVSPPDPTIELFMGIFIVAAIIVIIVDQYRLRKK